MNAALTSGQPLGELIAEEHRKSAHPEATWQDCQRCRETAQQIESLLAVRAQDP